MFNQIIQRISSEVIVRSLNNDNIKMHCNIDSDSGMRRWFDDKGNEYTEEQILIHSHN